MISSYTMCDERIWCEDPDRIQIRPLEPYFADVVMQILFA